MPLRLRMARMRDPGISFEEKFAGSSTSASGKSRRIRRDLCRGPQYFEALRIVRHSVLINKDNLAGWDRDGGQPTATAGTFLGECVPIGPKLNASASSVCAAMIQGGWLCAG